MGLGGSGFGFKVDWRGFMLLAMHGYTGFLKVEKTVDSSGFGVARFVLRIFVFCSYWHGQWPQLQGLWLQVEARNPTTLPNAPSASLQVSRV